MVIRVQRNANVIKQTTLLDGIDVGLPNLRICRSGLNQSVHEGMENISIVKVHLRTHSGNIDSGCQGMSF